MQAAEVLGIAAEDVHPSVGDTDSVGYTFLTGGSRVTFATGWAAHDCAQDIKKKMIERAATIWDVSADDVELEDGEFRHKSDPDLKMTFKELSGQLNGSGGPISSQVSVDPKGAGGAFSTHIVDVEVDPETGKVTILDYTAIQDAGKAIHPSYVEGQMQGGVVQGIGWALNEEYVFDKEGRMENSSFLDYRMPTSLDLPMISTVIVEVANPGHPYGVRGVGEVPIVPPMAAIANAISNTFTITISNAITNAIANAQGQVEAQNFESRKNVLKYDDVMDRQRKVIYAERRQILEGADLEAQIRTFIDDVVTGYVTGATQEEDWEMEQLATALRQIFPVSLDLEGMAAAVDGAVNLDRDELIEALKADAHKAYDAREAELGEEVMRELERRVILSVLDRKWREHLYEMDYLREGIYLRAYSQRDPLVEYQREGFDMFAAVMDGIKEETVGYLFNVQVTVEEDEDADYDEDDENVLVIDPTLRSPVGQPHIHAKGLDAPTSPANLTYSAPDESGEAEVRRDGPKASEGWKSKGGKGGAKKSRKR